MVGEDWEKIIFFISTQEKIKNKPQQNLIWKVFMNYSWYAEKYEVKSKQAETNYDDDVEKLFGFFINSVNISPKSPQRPASTTDRRKQSSSLLILSRK